MNTLTQEYAQADLLNRSESTGDDDGVMLHFDDATPLQEDFDEKVKHAQDELERVRQRADQLERQKNEYEELSQKQERFLRGRAEVCDRLNRAFARLDRETFEAQSRITDLETIKDAFTRQLSVIEALHPENWSRAELRDELNRALGCIEDAEDEYARCMERVRPAGGDAEAAGIEDGPSSMVSAPSTAAQASADRGFVYWLKCGFAFTLPLMGFALVLTVVRTFFGA